MASSLYLCTQACLQASDCLLGSESASVVQTDCAGHQGKNSFARKLKVAPVSSVGDCTTWCRAGQFACRLVTWPSHRLDSLKVMSGDGIIIGPQHWVLLTVHGGAGQWVCLQNCQLAQSWMGELERHVCDRRDN